jgi:hypothetical protein
MRIQGGQLTSAAAAALASEGLLVELALFPLEFATAGADGECGLVMLPAAGGARQPAHHHDRQQQCGVLGEMRKPYVCAPGDWTIGALRSWLVDRLVGKKGETVRPELVLHCGGARLDDMAQTLAHVRDALWLPSCKSDAEAALSLALVRRSGGGVDGAAAAEAAAAAPLREQLHRVMRQRVMLLYYSTDL